MAAFELRHLNFQYPQSEFPTLRDISLTFPTGEIVLICGRSGSGKSTLLRRLKSCLADHGEQSGDVFLDGIPLNHISEEEQARRIAFVQQHPDDQIVTDQTFSELAFGLENLGMAPQKMRLRIAEVSNFFGIDEWFMQPVHSLSGGQKQLLNLASAVAMDPQVLILDEPTSQLDPVAASQFFSILKKLNEELGITILLSEQRLEEALPIAHRLVILEQGRVIAEGLPKEAILQAKETEIFDSFPTPTRLFCQTGDQGLPPLTIREGRHWLSSRKLRERNVEKQPEASAVKRAAPPLIRLKECCFRYERDGAEVLDSLSISLYSGEIYGLMGANGSGKSTLLHVLAGSLRPYRGKIAFEGRQVKKLQPQLHRLAALPQDPRCLFVGETVEEDLQEMEAESQMVREIIRLLELEPLLRRHPYDLSGGEQQRVALGKVLLTKPKLLLLDEPTKGMDAHFKRQFGALLHRLKEQGMAILLVSHDVEFCAAYADRCGLLFLGEVASEGTARRFFLENRFYTTAAARMSRGILPNVMQSEEILECIQN